uniref:CD44 antigen n=1 Tax=Micrurus surinamensis TaxID=129470 RepID=A0A2D4NVN2_MICSU
MAKFWLCAAVGFYVLLQLCAARMDLNISCRYAGVFHVEKNQRYSLTREEAVQLCEALNSTIPTYEQMKKAFTLGFETCRYGYIEDNIVLPRHTPYYLCAANNTGIYVLSSNISDRYDTYCFNSSESRDVVCEPVKELYSALPNNNSSIEIFNADGSRYFEGKKITERPQVTEDDSSVGSGSAIGRGTADPSDFTPEDDTTTFTPVYGREDHHYPHPGNPEDQNPQNPSPDPNKHSIVRDKNVTPLPEESGNSQPRMAHIPDWLIVVASLLALALILGVCIAVNSRRRCGQKKKLVINNGKGGIDEKKKDGLNGEASKSQEMVHLVHKEKPEDQKGPHDEFQAIDETQNQQDVPLKSGM